MKLFNDILKEKDTDGLMKFSQGRVYLFVSLIAYYAAIGVLTGKAIKPNVGFDTNTIQMIVDALQWVILLMAGYVFGGKGLEIVKLLMTRTTPNALGKKIAEKVKPADGVEPAQPQE